MHVVDRVRHRGTIDPVRAMVPPAVLTSYLPPAVACTDRLMGHLLLAPAADLLVGSISATGEMLASFGPVAAG